MTSLPGTETEVESVSRVCDQCGIPLSLRSGFLHQGQHLCWTCLCRVDPSATAQAGTSPPEDSVELAPLSARFFGQVLDAAVTWGIIAVVILASSAQPGAELVMVPLGLFLGLTYFFLADGLPGGSLGKRAVGITVLDARTGRPCSYLQSLGRNILAILGIFDWMFIFGKRRQRLGDMAAKTIVVRGRLRPSNP